MVWGLLGLLGWDSLYKPQRLILGKNGAWSCMECVFIFAEAARAKLAFKSGKRPLPPQSRPGTSSPAPRQGSNDLKPPAIANKKKILSLGGPAKSNGKPGKIFTPNFMSTLYWWKIFAGFVHRVLLKLELT